jgi:hypothetical protein
MCSTHLVLPAAVLKPYMKPALATYSARIKDKPTHPDRVNFAMLSVLFQHLVNVKVAGNELSLNFDWGGKDTYDVCLCYAPLCLRFCSSVSDARWTHGCTVVCVCGRMVACGGTLSF